MNLSHFLLKHNFKKDSVLQFEDTKFKQNTHLKESLALGEKSIFFKNNLEYSSKNKELDLPIKKEVVINETLSNTGEPAQGSKKTELLVTEEFARMKNKDKTLNNIVRETNSENKNFEEAHFLPTIKEQLLSDKQVVNGQKLDNFKKTEAPIKSEISISKEILQTIEREFTGFNELKSSKDKITFIIENKNSIMKEIVKLDMDPIRKEKVIDALNILFREKGIKQIDSLINTLRRDDKNKTAELSPAIGGANAVEGQTRSVVYSTPTVDKIEVGNLIKNFKEEIIKLQEFRFDSPNKVQLLIREGNDYLRMVVHKTSDAIVVNTISNSDTTKEKAEIVLREIRTELRERNIEVKVENGDQNKSDEEEDRRNNKDGRHNESHDEYPFYRLFEEEDE